MNKFSNDFLNAMSIDEIRARVNSVRAGSWHKIMILDGVPISLSPTSTLYITETFSVRFKINYRSMPHVTFRDMVYLAETPDDVAACRRVYEKLKHKEIVAKTAVRELIKKEGLVAAGTPLPPVPEIEEESTAKKRDAACPSLVYCNNGSITLTCYASFKNSIKSVKNGFEYSEDSMQRRYFIKKDGEIWEISPDEDEKIKQALVLATNSARDMAKKKTGGATSVFTPKVGNILHIW